MSVTSDEVFVPLAGFETLYQISNHGRVRSLPRWRKTGTGGYWSKGGFLAGKRGPKGYIQYELRDGNGGNKMLRRNRLVAMHFIPNPLNKEQVNHIDGKRDNDHVSNLEWATQSENIQHSYDHLGRRAAYKGKFGKDHNQSIPVTATNGRESFAFESKTECALALKTTVQNVYRALRYGGTCGGFKIQLAK